MTNFVTEYSFNMLSFSQATAHKDLDGLENMRIVTHEHEYALPRGMDDLNSRITYHYE